MTESAGRTECPWEEQETLETLQAGNLELTAGAAGILFTAASRAQPERTYTLTAPRFLVDGTVRDDFQYQSCQKLSDLPRGGTEHVLNYKTSGESMLLLAVTVRSYSGSPFIRFRYTLTSEGANTARLTKDGSKDSLRYFSVTQSRSAKAIAYSADDALSHSPQHKLETNSLRNNDLRSLQQIQLSHFDPVAHSYLPMQETYAASELYEGMRFVGPIALLEFEDRLLIAYEHGADHPNGFLDFTIRTQARSGQIEAEVGAVKGNYYDAQEIGAASPFTSVWFELGIADLSEEAFLHRYRQFFLEEAAENGESRKPYIYYNTWNHQERKKYFDGLPYLTDMNQERMLAEIEVAHRIGIDVFVIDTGWYQKTGDWEVNLERFPEGLRDIKALLDKYGMKLGLWFNPTVAAQTSKIYREHPEYVMSREGKPNFWGQIWETEESWGMCLASGYADHFIETMVRLNQELGVVYFKWDAIGQYGCDSSDHDHGTKSNTLIERADCYAYESGRQMIRIVEEVGKRCPEVVVDFDVTEGGRFVGLGFLSVGKYFLCNNGPYFHDFDIPGTTKIAPDTINAFFYPGAARSRVCRQGAKYDAVLPSILFLTHYLPDGPAISQANALAALVLGGNGIWGDLLSLSAEEVARLAEPIRHYKRVAQAVTNASPLVRGFAGSSPEVHEKLDAGTATGLVAFFTVAATETTYVTQPIAAEKLRDVKGALEWEILPDNRVKLRVALERNGAKVVFFSGELS